MEEMTRQQFLEFAKGKKIYREQDALNQFYNNNYSVYRQCVEFIYLEQVSYSDNYYYYDKEKNIIIEYSYNIGD